MQTDDLILAEDFCNNNNISFSFISTLHNFGLVSITTSERGNYIKQSELRRLEQLARLHYEVEINVEGIDAITHLLDTVQSVQSELAATRNRLRLYEDL